MATGIKKMITGHDLFKQLMEDPTAMLEFLSDVAGAHGQDKAMELANVFGVTLGEEIQQGE